MKSRTLTCIAAMALFAALAVPARLVAQDNGATAPAKKAQHHHYKLIDMGTFGGPASSINYPFAQGTLNNHGVAVGWSATSNPTSPTSSPLICGGIDGVVPFITHAFEWQSGIVTDLGSLAGADYCSEPTWVNNRGEIVGISENGQFDPLLFVNQARAVLWKDGKITDLGSLGGYEAAAFAINSSGQIAGNSTNTIPDPYCFFGTAQLRTFLWQDGQMQDLGSLGGNCGSGIGTIAINERGQIVGNSSTSTIVNPVTGLPPFDPFLWEEGKGMTDLGTLGGAFGAAQSINNRGQVIGQSSIASDPGACNGFPDNGDLNCHAFLWEKRRLIDLTTTTIGGNPEYLAQINDGGEIVGWGVFPNAPMEAFLWRKGVAMDLGHLSDCYSIAHTLNSQSQVVGLTLACDHAVHAFLWEKGSIVDLNTLIPHGSSLQLADAMTINDRGEITGIGTPLGISTGNFITEGHGFLLIPCDDDHPSIEGCDYSMVEAAEVSTDTSAMRAPQTTQLSQEAIARIMNVSRNPFMRRYRRPVLRPAPSN